MISGERLQAIADVTVASHERLRFHTSCPDVSAVVINPDRSIDPTNWRALRAARTIFVYSDLVEVFFATIMPRLEHPVVLITHNGDRNVTEADLARIEHPLLKHWFAQNLSVAHPKATGLPIGIGNAQWKHGDAVAVAHAARSARASERGVYVNFAVSTRPDVRGPLLESLSRLPFTYLGARENIFWKMIRRIGAGLGLRAGRQPRGQIFSKYICELSEWRYCISPPGNGLDCHRTWEALYLGVIPIVSRGLGDLFDGLPVIVVDDLAAITMQELEAAEARFPASFAYERLRLSWWREAILSTSRS
jgi:hypothetical protein